MRILFLCNSLEKGRDGVGDYIRLLAQGLAKRGHHVTSVSIREENILDFFIEQQSVDGIQLFFLRISKNLQNSKCTKYLQDWIASHPTDWVSLQFVNFGFQRYGLPLSLFLIINPIRKQHKLHIMFHELWCGVGPNQSNKIVILGWFQRVYIQLLHKFYNPKWVFTNSQLSKELLKNINIDALIVPVFSNILINDFALPQVWHDLLITTHLSAIENCKNEWLTLGFFGTTYSFLDLQQILNDALKAASILKRKLAIIEIGYSRNQSVQDLALSIPKASFFKTGLLSSALVNQTMTLIDIGVITSPANLLSKSGAANAWLERGIPVLIGASDLTYNFSTMGIQGIFQSKSVVDIINCFNAKNQFLFKNSFIDTLNSYELL